MKTYLGYLLFLYLGSFASASVVIIGDSLAREVAPYLEAEISDVTRAGMGSQTTQQILSRFEQDTAGIEQVVLIAGVNDLWFGLPVSDALNNFEAMFDLTVANNQSVLAHYLLPWTEGWDEHMQQWDILNQGLQTLSVNYSNVTLLDLREPLGIERSSGPEGNRWDLKPVYNSGDDVHLTSAGYTLWVEHISSALTAQQDLNLLVLEVRQVGNTISLAWSGGQPPYQTQWSEDLQSWSNLGAPINETSKLITIDPTLERGFFRVVTNLDP